MPKTASRGPLTRLHDAWNALTGRTAPASTGSGSLSTGGSTYSDAWGAKLGPSPTRLVEAYKSIIFFCTNLNADAVTALDLRLYVASGGVRAKPRSLCGPVKVTEARRNYLAQRAHASRLVTSSVEVHEVTNHPILDTLDHPDPDGYFDRAQWVNLICRYIDVVGTAYIKAIDGPMGPPDELWPLQSQYVWPQRSGMSALIDHYQYFTETYKFDELMRFRLRPGLRDPYGSGYAAAQAAWEYAQLEDKFVSVQEQVLGNGPRPGLLVSAKDPETAPGEPERKRFEQDLNRQHGRGMQGRALVTNGAWNVNPVTYPPADLAGLGISEYDLERTGNCFSIPPPFFSKDTNLANMVAAETAHAKKGVQPRCDAIASRLTREIRKYDERLFFAFDPACGEDAERQAKIIDLGLKNGRYTINQVKAMDNEPPVPWGEEPWLNVGLIQPTTAERRYQEGRADDQAAMDAQLEADAAAQDAANEATKEAAKAKDKPKPKPKAKRHLREGEQRGPFVTGSRATPNAHEILAATLKRLRMSQAYLDGSLSGAERYDLLHAIRQDARAWFRSEAEIAFAEILADQAEAERGLLGKARDRASTFFDKARKYLREVLVAGVLAMSRSGDTMDSDLAAIEEATRYHVSFMDRFARELMDRGVATSTEDVAPAPDDGFSAAEFTARAESYGAAVWPVTVNITRARALSSEIFDREARFHIGPRTETDPCEECAYLEGQGWQPIGTLPPIGEQTCRQNDHCIFRFMDAEGVIYDVGGGPWHDVFTGERG